jgi:hypothetical protein
MLSPRNKVTIILITSALLVAGGTLGTASAQKASVPKPQNRLALGEEQVKQLLLLMETNPQGKVSKQEYMKFMEAEFERLDTEKKGELDVRQVAHTNLTASRYTGK